MKKLFSSTFFFTNILWEPNITKKKKEKYVMRMEKDVRNIKVDTYIISSHLFFSFKFFRDFINN